MIHVHIVSNSFFPTHGGMEKSIDRISNSLASIPGFKVHVYVRSLNESYDNYKDLRSIKNLYSIKKNIFEPCEYYDDVYEQNKWKEKEYHRLEFLTLRNEIEKISLKFKKDSHVIVSFYMSTTGFFCQHVSNNLNIPHVVAVRGWDFSRDFYSLYGIGSINFVLNNANHIVTTNDEQLKYLRNLSDESSKISTIYNAVNEQFFKRKWAYQKKQSILLISDIGFQYGKGSHILLKSFEHLMNKGYPLILKIIGETEKNNKIYWNNAKKKYKAMYPTSFFYEEFLESSKKLQSFLLKGDIYCAPTLSEGCSNARIQALVVGIPMVTTACGEIVDFYDLINTSLIELSRPADIEGFTRALERMIKKIREKRIQASPNTYYNSLKKVFSPIVEKEKWEKVINGALKPS